MMPRYNSGDVPNPLKRLREESGMTLKRVSRGTGFSKQFIIKQEQGVYHEPSKTIVDFYDADYKEVCKDYREFQRACRKANYGRLIEPWHFNVNEGKNPWITWRELSGVGSEAAICKFFCLHPAIMFKFERGDMTTVPDLLIEALLESGYSHETLNKLGEAYEAWRKSQTLEVVIFDAPER